MYSRPPPYNQHKPESKSGIPACFHCDPANDYTYQFASFNYFSIAATGYLIANLAVADLSVGILCIPFTVLYFEFTYWPFGFALCKIIPATQAICIMASIGTLTAISIGEF